MNASPRAHALIFALALFSRAWAEVSLVIPAPPKPAPAPADAQLQADLALGRAAWLAQLARVHAVKVTAWSEGAEVDCQAAVRARLVREGYELHTAGELLALQRTHHRPFAEELAEVVGGNLARKVAVRTAPGVWLAVSPKPGTPPTQWRANWLKALQGVGASGLGRVSFFLYREFRLPVGGVCAEVELQPAATLSDLALLLDLAARAITANAIRPGPAR